MNLAFSTNETNKMRVDPRTKILILIMISIFVFGGAGGSSKFIDIVRLILVLIPLGLLLFEKKFKVVFFYGAMYAVFLLAEIFILDLTTGMLNFILLFNIGMFVRIMPGALAGYYLMSTTTISELVAAMQRMKLSDKVIIPLSVIFRFFPTVVEEGEHIGNAMRMRGIYFGGKNISKIIEYRFIPMITCSVKVGEELSASALSRGLGAPIKRSNICEIGFHFWDYIIIALYIVMLSMLFVGI